MPIEFGLCCDKKYVYMLYYALNITRSTSPYVRHFSRHYSHELHIRIQ